MKYVIWISIDCGLPIEYDFRTGEELMAFILGFELAAEASGLDYEKFDTQEEADNFVKSDDCWKYKSH